VSVETLGFEITAKDQASDVARTAARNVERAALGVDQAQQKVERATKAAGQALERYGKESLQAREASTKLRAAQLSAGDATVKLARAQNQAQAELRKTADAAQDAERSVGKMADGMKTAAAAGGVAAGAALTQGIQSSLDLSASRAKLQAQLGLTADDAGRFGKIAGDVYAGNYGSSIEEVSEALRQSAQQGLIPPEATNAQIESIAQNVLSLSAAFDQDLSGAARAAGQLIRTGLAKDTTEAFDLITVGLQKIPGAGEDLLDTLNEYSTQFRSLGIDGNQALGFIYAAMQGGARDTDIAADALKEFNLRARDVTNTGAQQALAQLGLDAEDLAAKVAGGGQSASAAMAQILTKLQAYPDPARQAALATALFGTQSEDLQAALLKIDPSTLVNGLGDVSGAADQLNASLGDSAQAKLDGFKRKLEGMARSAVEIDGPLGTAAAAVVTLGGSALDQLAPLASLAIAFRTQKLVAREAAIATDGAAAANTRLGKSSKLGAVGKGGAYGAAAVGLTLGVKAFADSKFPQFADADYSNVDQALSGAVKSNDPAKIAQASAAWLGISKTLRDVGLSAGDVKAKFPEFNAALEENASRAETAAGGQKQFGAATKDTSGAMKDQVTAAQDLQTALDRLNGKHISADEAAIHFRDSLRGLGESLKENGKSFKEGTEAGDANRTSFINAAKSASDYIQTLRDQKAPAEQVTAAQEQMRQGLIKTAVQAGVSKTEAEKLADAYFQIPLSRKTELKGDIGDLQSKIADAKKKLKDPKLTDPERSKIRGDIRDLEAKLAEARRELNNLNGKAATVYVRYRVTGNKPGGLDSVAGGGRFSTGGRVRGPGTGDSVPALLTPEEHVLTVAEVKALGGHAAVEKMRSAALKGQPVSESENRLRPGTGLSSAPSGGNPLGGYTYKELHQGFTEDDRYEPNDPRTKAFRDAQRRAVELSRRRAALRKKLRAKLPGTNLLSGYTAKELLSGKLEDDRYEPSDPRAQYFKDSANRRKELARRGAGDLKAPGRQVGPARLVAPSRGAAPVTIDFGGKGGVDELGGAFLRYLRKQIRVQGGDVQRVLGAKR
jgi:phage-related minor tail protein